MKAWRWVVAGIVAIGTAAAVSGVLVSVHRRRKSDGEDVPGLLTDCRQRIEDLRRDLGTVRPDPA